MSDPRRFIGRKSSGVCRHCGGSTYYVNRMGGIVCEACSPPAMGPDGKVIAGEIQIRLVTSGGVWDDAENPFDCSDAGSGSPSPTSPQSAPQANEDWRLRQLTPVERRQWGEAAAVQGVGVLCLMDAIGVAFGTPEQQASVGLGGGWSPEPTWLRMDRLMQKVKKCGLPVVW